MPASRIACYMYATRLESQCAAVCYSILQRVAVCCGALHICNTPRVATITISALQCVAVCCSVLHICSTPRVANSKKAVHTTTPNAMQTDTHITTHTAIKREPSSAVKEIRPYCNTHCNATCNIHCNTHCNYSKSSACADSKRAVVRSKSALLYMYDGRPTTCQSVTVPRLVHVCHDSSMCAMTHPYVRHDSSIYVPRLIHMSAVTQKYVCRDSSIYMR